MKIQIIFLFALALVGCSASDAELSGSRNDNRNVLETRENVCSGAAAIIRANTALMQKMRENIDAGFFDWDPGLFWDHGTEVANLAAPLRDSAHDDDPSFNSAVNSLEFAYSQFSSQSFIDSVGSSWTENRDYYVSVSQALLGPLERFEPYC